jgi:hypothetical protein
LSQSVIIWHLGCDVSYHFFFNLVLQQRPLCAEMTNDPLRYMGIGSNFYMPVCWDRSPTFYEGFRTKTSIISRQVIVTRAIMGFDEWFRKKYSRLKRHWNVRMMKLRMTEKLHERSDTKRVSFMQIV